MSRKAKGENKPELFEEVERDLEKQTEEVLLQLAVELDRNAVVEAYEQGWTKKDIIREILNHLKSAIGRSDIPDSRFIEEIDITDIKFEEE